MDNNQNNQKNKKESFILYNSFWDSLTILNDSQLGLLFRAIYHSVLGLDPIDLTTDGFVWMAFNFIHHQIRLDTEKYEHICRARADAGIKSGLARRNKTKQNEHMFNNINNNDNGNDKESVADNADNDVETLGVATTTKEYYEYYSIIYFRNITHPVEETKAFIDYYEDQQWTLKGGRVLTTLSERCAKANKWTPHNPLNTASRVDADFLERWHQIYERMKSNGVSLSILYASLDEKINIRYPGSAPDMLFIKAPKVVVEYLKSTKEKEYKDILLELCQTMNHKRSTKAVDFFPLEDIV